MQKSSKTVEKPSIDENRLMTLAHAAGFGGNQRVTLKHKLLIFAKFIENDLRELTKATDSGISRTHDHTA